MLRSFCLCCILIISGSSLYSCMPYDEPSSLSYDAFSNANLIYSTPNNELVALQKNGDENVITIHPDQNIARWSYSPYDQTLYEHTSIWSENARFYNQREQGRLSHNFDGCGGGALIGEIDAFLFVADDGLLSGKGSPNGSLSLVAYSPKLEYRHIRLYDFPTNMAELSQPDRCFVGTNAEYDGILFFSDFDNDMHALRALELDSRTVKTLFTDDIIMAPAISPKGDRIAYTKYDGIYLFELSTGRKTHLVELDWIHEREYEFKHLHHAFFTFVPVVSWLPSGDEFSYHVESISSDPQTGKRTVSYDIYTYNLVTNLSTLMIENGMNPYWILP